jgi:hypothetical protein
VEEQNRATLRISHFYDMHPGTTAPYDSMTSHHGPSIEASHSLSIKWSGWAILRIGEDFVTMKIELSFNSFWL